MGLALFALSNIEPLSTGADWLVDHDEDSLYDFENGFYVSQNEYDRENNVWNGYINDDLQPDTIYVTPNNEYDVFSMGAYSTYNGFRNTLIDYADTTGSRVDPFYNLGSFTDCDGVLGTTFCDELWTALTNHRPFYQTFLEEEEYDDIEYLMGWYDNLTDAMDYGRNNGAVVFC